MKGYTTREVADALGLPTSRIQTWTRAGLLRPERGPKGTLLFSFQDLVLLRSARELLEQEISTRRVREALHALRDQLPSGRPLSAVRVSALGNRVLVRDGDVCWEPDSGQLQIDFAEIGVERSEGSSLSVEAARNDDPGADEWFDTGLDLEAGDPEGAVSAYRRALEIDPGHADAHLNVGRLLHEDGCIGEAEEHYREAATLDPANARARFNLGVALEDRGSEEEAMARYREAVEIDPGLAAAHFNLSRLLEASGDAAAAIGHLAEYKRLMEKGA